MEAPQTGRTAEIVPIADRSRYMDSFRAALVAVVVAILVSAPKSLTVSAVGLIYAAGAYAALAILGRVVFTAVQRSQRIVFGGMLLVDAAFLAWAGYATGAAESPLRFVMLLHVMAVALLASYRTGLKLALWHSLLLIVVFYAQQGGALETIGAAGIGIGTPFQRLIEFAGLFWTVAIATAALSAVNERELRRRRFDTEALATMATTLESVSDPNAVAATVVDAIAETFDFDRVLLIAGRDEDPPAILAKHGAARDTGSVAFDPASSALAHACAEGETVVVAGIDEAADPWLASVLPGARNLLAVPLVADGHSLGVLVAVQGRRLSPRIARRVVSMLERFVSHGTLALRNAWLLEQVHTMATTDGLTGVMNRATFDQTLTSELSRAARHQEDASLLLLDIDHFKALNDQHGHQTGDEVLTLVGATLRRVCRDFDAAARYGGEEFALILPATDTDGALAVAERVRLAIAELPHHLPVTVSVGVATFPVHGADADALIGAADAALYASKRAGRNRTTAAPRAIEHASV